MSKAVLHASALLAYLLDEPGSDRVAEALSSGSFVCAVNLCEVLSKLEDRGLRVGEALEALTSQGILDALEIVAFDAALARETASLRAATRGAGLSLGDRACIALAKTLAVPALTADRTWPALPGVEVRPIR